MLIRILADAFEITIKLYQKHSSGKVQELKFTCAQSQREIWMKFYRDPKKDERNYYDSVVVTSDGTLEPVGFDLTGGSLQDTIDSSQDNTLDLSDLLGPEGSEAVPTINRGNYFPLGMFSEWNL